MLWPLNPFPHLRQFKDPEYLELRRGQVPLRKDPSTVPKMYTTHLFPNLSQGEPVAFFQGDCVLGKGNNQSFGGIAGHGL